MEKTKLNLPLPLPLYRGIVSEGTNAGKMIEGSALFSIIDGEYDISIAPSDNEALIRSIRPETLGVYIGKEDMDGKNIFTGDVLEFETVFEGVKIIEYFMPYWHEGVCGFMLKSSHSEFPLEIGDKITCCEIIGNIHENPELLRLFPHLQGVNE